PMNVQAPLGKLDLMPLQVAQLRGPQAMPIGDQDHRGVAVTTAAVLAGGSHQPLDLLLGQIPTGSGLWNCQLYSVWCRALGCRKHRSKLLSKKTVAGRATNMKMATTIMPPTR